MVICNVKSWWFQHYIVLPVRVLPRYIRKSW